MGWEDVKEKAVILLVVALSTCFYAYGQEMITHPNEVTALVAIHGRLEDPVGYLRSWVKEKDPCTSWFYFFAFFQNKTEAPEPGSKHMEVLNIMWNSISGSIPKEIGSITALRLLLLSGNQISGPLPMKLGYLPNLITFQLDLNDISGPIPKSFAKLPKVAHFHMNNNSISGQIPPELQLDNNNFEGSVVPASYSNMSKLLKLSLKNCNLQGTVPDLSTIPELLYLSLNNNRLSGFVPTTIWENKTFSPDAKLRLNLQHNLLSDISGILDPPPDVNIM
ncbi:hypothetical protein HAX54_016846 [Datura stramonium]|uniref:Leucine-rich repeat-containing N-terminal plant-type domain-containing protein n=1 Tax=Datura stramonium TaxID=4076 RepID=A0ABS8ULL5_DATST|nr:hypothetical protein [Datura stramonium]